MTGYRTPSTTLPPGGGRRFLACVRACVSGRIRALRRARVTRSELGREKIGAGSAGEFRVETCPA